MVVGPECRYCKASCIKNGRSRSAVQRYYCKNCQKCFQLTYKNRACWSTINTNIVCLLKESCGIRSIARLLRISASTVITRIKTIASALRSPQVITKRKVYEVDEMRTYIRNKKSLYWIVYALERDTRTILNFNVGKRTTHTLKRVIDTVLLSEAKMVYTDGYALYSNLIPQEVHCCSKYKINYIERNNLSIRTHLKRLSRKTICFSKSKTMLEACLKIYFWGDKR